MTTPKPLFSSKPVVKAEGPKVLFGGAEVRKRIDVKIGDLEGKDEFKKEALNIILTSNLEKVDYKRVLEFGGGEQAAHQQILQSLLSVFNSPEVHDIKNVLNEAVDCLKPKGFLGKFFEKEPDIQGLEQGKPILYQLKEDCGKIHRELIQLGNKLEPLIIACLFFSKYQKDGFPNELFVGRAASLITTQSTIQTNLQQEEIFSQGINNLIDCINNFLLNDFPIFQTNLLTKRQSVV